MKTLVLRNRPFIVDWYGDVINKKYVSYLDVGCIVYVQGCYFKIIKKQNETFLGTPVSRTHIQDENDYILFKKHNIKEIPIQRQPKWFKMKFKNQKTGNEITK